MFMILNLGKLDNVQKPNFELFCSNWIPSIQHLNK